MEKRLQFYCKYLLFSEQNHISDIQTVEITDMWICDQENFTLDYEWKDINHIYIYIYIYVCVCVIINIQRFLWPCRV